MPTTDRLLGVAATIFVVGALAAPQTTPSATTERANTGATVPPSDPEIAPVEDLPSPDGPTDGPLTLPADDAEAPALDIVAAGVSNALPSLGATDTKTTDAGAVDAEAVGAEEPAADEQPDDPIEEAADEATPSTPPCEASWYGGDDGFVGRTTANGETFDDTLLTAAMWDVPLGSTWQVTNAATGDHVTVRINDRGPARRLNRCIDLSRAAFDAIGPLGAGHLDVTLEPVG